MPSYDSMPAGREMDALVADKVMGWKCHALIASMMSKPRKILTDDDIPHYSTSIVDAWTVIEKFHRELVESGKGCGIELHCGVSEWQLDDPPDKPKKDYAVFSCSLRIGDDINWEFWGDSMPHAICRTALMAVEK